MKSPLSPEHRAYIRKETGVALVINSVLSLVFSLLVVHGRATVPLWGPGNMAFDFVPQLFMMTFATTLAVTLITRKRLAAGAVAPWPGRPMPLPRNAGLRAVLLGLGAVVVLAPLSIAVLYALGVSAAPAAPFVIGKVAYGAAVSLVIARPIILAALSRNTLMGSLA